MKTCCVDGCNHDGVFRTRTRPTWCLNHLYGVYAQGGLDLLEGFTKTTDFLLTRCLQCNFKGHYRFEYVLDRTKIGEPVCRACYWRSWAKRSRSLSGKTEQPVDISIVQQKAEKHGFTYLGPLTDPSLDDDPHATRCNSCGRIEAQRDGDIGWGCPCQRNQKTSTVGTKKTRGANLLKNSRNPALEWWDHNRNAIPLWETATLKSRGVAWWTCPEGHSFKARIVDVTTGAFPCSECQKVRQVARDEKLASFDDKTIADVPELLAAWDEDLPPESVPVSKNHWGSGYRFRCSSGHLNTRHPLSYLFGGCSACKAIETRRAYAEAAKKDPSATRLTPEISSQWDHSKNGNIKLATISPNSRRAVWWKDPVCGHEFQATPVERDKYERWRCPICRTILDSLAYHYPEIAEEWSPDNLLSPWEIRPNAARLKDPPLWVCKNNASHVWRAMPTARVSGSQCPECIETGKSQIEVEYCSASFARWGNAKSGARIHSARFETHSSWTVDILVDLPMGGRLAIEYDGSYWHRDKVATDRAKSLDLLAGGFIVVRLREDPLPSLRIAHPHYHELTVYSAGQDPASDVALVDGMVSS